MNKEPEDFTKEDVFDATVLREHYINYLKNVIGYNNVEARIASEDMLNPYDTPYVFFDYYCIATIDGKRFQVYKCRTDFTMVAYYLTQYPAFQFYMLVNEADVPNSKVVEYSNAEKLFAITDEMKQYLS